MREVFEPFPLRDWMKTLTAQRNGVVKFFIQKLGSRDAVRLTNNGCKRFTQKKIYFFSQNHVEYNIRIRTSISFVSFFAKHFFSRDSVSSAQRVKFSAVVNENKENISMNSLLSLRCKHSALQQKWYRKIHARKASTLSPTTINNFFRLCYCLVFLLAFKIQID